MRAEYTNVPTFNSVQKAITGILEIFRILNFRKKENLLDSSINAMGP